MWGNGKHQSREITSGHLRSDRTEGDENLVPNIFDTLYWKEDVHNKPYSERYKLLQSVKWPQSTDGVPKTSVFNLTPTVVVKSTDKEKLAKVVKKIAGYVASEGIIMKDAESTYELDGKIDAWVKFKPLGEIFCVIGENVETRTPGVFNIKLGLVIPRGMKVPEKQQIEIAGKKYAYVGKTFNVKGRQPIGKVVACAFHTLFHYVDEATGEQYVKLYEPYFGEIVEKKPDTIESAIKKAKYIELYQKKAMQAVIPMDDKPHEGVLQHHFRGKSVHSDFRVEVFPNEPKLFGITLDDQKKGVITEDVDTVEEARAIDREWSKYSKLTDDPSDKRKIMVERKAREPSDWLFPGKPIGYAKVVPPGTVGATKEHEGVFIISDRFKVYLGAQKPHFREFFIHGKRMTGRWVVVDLPNPYREEMPRREFITFMWKPEDQTPYVLTSRAVKKRWIPPKGVSCLPPEIRSEIPSEFMYWKIEDENERLTKRDELVKNIRLGKIKIKSLRHSFIHLQEPPDIGEATNVPFVLQHHWWHSPAAPVRAGPTEEYYHLRIEWKENEPLLCWTFRDNPAEGPASGVYRPSKDHDWMTKQGEIKPGQQGNPNKKISAWIDIIDKGKVTIYEMGDIFGKFHFKGKLMKGTYIIKRRDPKSTMWAIEKVEASP